MEHVGRTILFLCLAVGLARTAAGEEHLSDALDDYPTLRFELERDMRDKYPFLEDDDAVEQARKDPTKGAKYLLEQECRKKWDLCQTDLDEALTQRRRTSKFICTGLCQTLEVGFTTSYDYYFLATYGPTKEGAFAELQENCKKAAESVPKKNWYQVSAMTGSLRGSPGTSDNNCFEQEELARGTGPWRKTPNECDGRLNYCRSQLKEATKSLKYICAAGCSTRESGYFTSWTNPHLVVTHGELLDDAFAELEDFACRPKYWGKPGTTHYLDLQGHDVSGFSYAFPLNTVNNCYRTDPYKPRNAHW